MALDIRPRAVAGRSKVSEASRGATSARAIVLPNDPANGNANCSVSPRFDIYALWQRQESESHGELKKATIAKF